MYNISEWVVGPEFEAHTIGIPMLGGGSGIPFLRRFSEYRNAHLKVKFLRQSLKYIKNKHSFLEISHCPSFSFWTVRVFFVIRP